jgi:regulator of protease activity HflC (stomatin/prohibitin superfamily)
VAVRFELSKDPLECVETIVSFRSEDRLRKQTLVPLTEAAIRNSARLLSAQEYVSGNGGKMEQAFQDQLSNGLYVLEKIRTVGTDSRKERVGTKDLETDKDKQVRYQISIKMGKSGLPERTYRSTDKYGIVVSQAEVSSINPSAAFKKKLENQMAESARGALEREKTKALQFQKEREEAQGELDKVKRQLDAEKRQIESLVESKAQEQRAENRHKAVIIEEKIAMKEARIKKLRADAEAYAKKKIMLADGALEKRLEAYVKSVEAMAGALTDKRLVPEVYMGGNGEGAPNATELINLMTAKFARDLGVGSVPTGTK